ncbi:efflux RND transporter periplasmic adaptor subunit [Edwardsiella tarda]|uniref:efflux RND transporter periplasmic adaptor subunit n=1 Tax=Edwardsiella tarda TaxID=636 RepID=UPI003D2F43DC
MKLHSLKYFSSVIVCVIALCAGGWLWNYYMQSPWTRDGRVRAELVTITPEVSGRIAQVAVRDNQAVVKGQLLFTLDSQPFLIARDRANAALMRAQSDLEKAQHEAARRARLPAQVISAESLDEARLTAQAMQAAYRVAKEEVAQAEWDLAHVRILAPTDGFITNLQTRAGNYAQVGTPLVALLDRHSFYVMGYFEETKLRHIRVGDRADIQLYDGDRPLRGRVESIGRAIYDQSADRGADLLLSVKPSVPWVRLAQRVPVRIALSDIKPDTLLVSGMTCTIVIKP